MCTVPIKLINSRRKSLPLALIILGFQFDGPEPRTIDRVEAVDGEGSSGIDLVIGIVGVVLRSRISPGALEV